MSSIDRLLTGGKRLMRGGVHELARWSGYSTLRATSIGKPRILMYHDIHEQGLPAPVFARQLGYLKRRFEIVSLDDFSRRRLSGTLNGAEVILTFDDGVQNHYNVVYPILREHQVPATFFVCPGLIETGEWMWNAELRERLAFLDVPARRALARQAGGPDGGVEHFVSWAKSLDPNDRAGVVARIRSVSHEFRPAPELVDRYAPVSWAQLRELDSRLITIGSHTMSHPILPTLPIALAEQEIAQSRRILEEKLDRKVSFFCYPNGLFNDSVADCVRKNYELAVTTRPGFVGADTPSYLLPRIGAGETMARFQWLLHRP